MHYLRESIPPKGLFKRSRTATHRCEGNGKRSPDATNVVTMIVCEESISTEALISHPDLGAEQGIVELLERNPKWVVLLS